MTAPIAERVDSSASGHKWLYVSSVVRADTCRIRAWTVLMSAREKISSDASQVASGSDIFRDLGSAKAGG